MAESVAAAQPAPLVAMAPVTVDGLPNPARLLLGMTRPCPDGQLADGWRWVAYRSVGFAHRSRRLQDPERWVAVELVSLRLADRAHRMPRRLARDRRDRWLARRAVVVWSREVVHLTRAKPGRDGLRRPGEASWSSEYWAWTAGLPGSIPRVATAVAVKQMIRQER